MVGSLRGAFALQLPQRAVETQGISAVLWRIHPGNFGSGLAERRAGAVQRRELPIFRERAEVPSQTVVAVSLNPQTTHVEAARKTKLVSPHSGTPRAQA